MANNLVKKILRIRDVRLAYAEGTKVNASDIENAALDMLGQWLPIERSIAVA
jgi:hypothetical protein